jgi:hypothetical protein
VKRDGNETYRNDVAREFRQVRRCDRRCGGGSGSSSSNSAILQSLLKITLN